MTYLTRDLAMDIYDLVKVHALSSGQDDGYATLSREHARQAAERIHDFIRQKNMDWDGDTIHIGNHVTITVSDDRYEKEITNE